MLHTQSPTAVVWTDTRPAYQSSVYEHALVDIRAIKTWIEREVDLARIRKLGYNWDGFEAAAPDARVWEKANAFLRLLRERDITNPPMRAVLSPNGSIALEWLEGDSFLRAEIGDSNEVEWMLVIPGQPTEFRVESLISSDSEAVQGQEWKPAPTAVGELAYASAH
jgi:hypothetical protein